MRCDGHQLVRVAMRERATDNINAAANAECLLPLVTTFALRPEHTGFFNPKTIPSSLPDTRRGFGPLEAYVCRRCGFVEWYAQSPEEIPISAAVGTELVEIPTPKGYR
jgi:hypothetical protein